MRTVSQVVENIIGGSPFFAEAMAEGIANNSEIARRIKPEVEKRLLEEVSEASVSMALHRLSGEMKKRVSSMGSLKRVDDITVRSGLAEYVSPNSADVLRTLEDAFRAARKNPDAFVNFSRGLREMLLVVNEALEKELGDALKRTKYIRRGGLSAITMRLPESSLNVPGLYYPVLKALAWEGISFVEVMSVDTEFSIIFEDKDVDRAFSILKRATA